MAVDTRSPFSNKKRAHPLGYSSPVTQIDAQARRLGQTALVGRLVAAHLLGYPLLFVGAAAGMSLAIVGQKSTLLAAGLATEPANAAQRWLMQSVGLTAADAAVFDVVMRPTGAVLLVVFLLVHVTAVPWALAARRHALGQAEPDVVVRERRRWIIASLGATGIVVVAGMVGWAIIVFSA